MAGLYGQRWYKDYGPEPSESWVIELSSMTPEKAVLGWKACRESGDAHCCTVPQFLKRVSDALKAARGRAPGPQLAQDSADPRLMANAARSREIASKALPPPSPERMQRLKDAEDVGQAAVNEIRGMLGR